MARLQVLQLPEGAGDERPPFVLIIDQIGSAETAEQLRNDLLTPAEHRAMTALGAPPVLTFTDTVDIPANDIPAGLCTPAGVSEPEPSDHRVTTQLVYAHERNRLDLAAALMLSGDASWEQLIEGARQAARSDAMLARVRSLPEAPTIMDAQHEQPNGYLHGYRVAIGDAKRAARLPVTRENAEADDDRGHLFNEPGFVDPTRCARCGVDPLRWKLSADRAPCTGPGPASPPPPLTATEGSTADG